jgi:hypothetical protein
MSAIALQELKQALERRFPDALPLGRGVAAAVGTGVVALDALLPGGGLARGRVTVWRPGGGATSILRTAAEAAVGRGERSAWVDVAGALSGDFWRSGPLLLRPAREHDALMCAEELLRSGGFAVVVVSGGGQETAREAIRLSRAARTGGSALVLISAESSLAHLRVQSHTDPGGYRWRRNPFGEPVEVVSARIEVEASALGWSGRTSLDLPVRTHRARLAPEPRLVDRRGAPPQARWRRARERNGGAAERRSVEPASRIEAALSEDVRARVGT